MFSFSSAGITLSYQESTLRQGMLLYSFACYTSRFQWAWAVKDAPSFINTSPSNGEASLQLAKLLDPLRVGARVPRRSRARLSWQVVYSANSVTPEAELPKTACVPPVPSSLCPQAFQGTLPSARWVLWQPLAVPVLTLQIRCLFSSSAKSKWTVCSDMSTNVAPLLLRQPSKRGFQTKHGLRLFKDGPLIPPSTHPFQIQK